MNPAGFAYSYPDPAEHPDDHFGVWLSTFADIQRVLDYMEEYYPGEPEERICVLGLRKEEALGLDWETVFPAERRVQVVQAYTQGDGEPALGPPKTPKALRPVPMTAHALRRFEEWGPGEGPVVTDRFGRRMRPSTARKRIAKVFAGGLKYGDGEPLPRLTQFSMRHSFGTSCINAGIEVARLAKWMGHCDTATTYNRYVKPKLADLSGDAGTIDAPAPSPKVKARRIPPPPPFRFLAAAR